MPKLIKAYDPAINKLIAIKDAHVTFFEYLLVTSKVLHAINALVRKVKKASKILVFGILIRKSKLLPR
jgi:hypothetical protein